MRVFKSFFNIKYAVRNKNNISKIIVVIITLGGWERRLPAENDDHLQVREKVGGYVWRCGHWRSVMGKDAF